MIWSPSPRKEAPRPDVQLSALDMDASLVDSGTVRKLFGVNDSPQSSDRSNTPPGALPQERLEGSVGASAGGKEGGLPRLEYRKSPTGFPAGGGRRKPRLLVCCSVCALTKLRKS